MRGLGTELYIYDGLNLVSVGCVTSISGISESMKQRDRTSLIDDIDQSEPSHLELSNIDFSLNFSRLGNTEAYLDDMRNKKILDIYVAFGIGGKITIKDGIIELPIDRDTIHFKAYNITWALSDLTANDDTDLTVSMKRLTKFDLKSVVPWVDDIPWLDNIFWR